MTAEESTEIEPTNDSELMELPPPAEDIVVLANNPLQVQDAQQHLLIWANRKVAIEEAALKEAVLNLEQSKKLKIRTSGWKNQVTSKQKRVVFYSKVRDAIEAGYYIVPNFPFQVIGVRTDRKKPPQAEHRHFVPPVKSNQLPTGEGRYVSATPLTESVKRTETNYKHEVVPVWMSKAYAFDQFDFPFKLVKPKVLSDLNQALQLKIFDEIGVLPAVNARGGDPMVVGILRRREGPSERMITFLISWWIDTRDL